MKRVLRIGYKLAYKTLSIYWKIFNPLKLGVNILLLRDKKVVLIKKSYVSGWHLPGGGVKKRESLEQAATRELSEELNCKAKNLRMFGVYTTFLEGKSDHVVVFATSDFVLGECDNLEIVEVQGFEVTNLPKNCSKLTKEIVSDISSDPSKRSGFLK